MDDDTTTFTIEFNAEDWKRVKRAAELLGMSVESFCIEAAARVALVSLYERDGLRSLE